MSRETLLFMSRQVAWYQRYGKYPQHRIRRERDGNLYVVGDFSWNRANPAFQEIIEPPMNKAMKQEAA